MKIWIISLILTLINSLTIAQVIAIVDKDLKPIGDVAVFDELKTVSSVSDSIGRVDLSGFHSSMLLLFQHPSYQELYIIKSEIKNNLVTLEDQVFEMKSVVISANKWEQDAAEIPNEILAIDSETVENNNPQTAADLLAQSGEIFVQKSQLGGGSPKLRGFSANSTLIVVDGVRMNNAIYRSGNLQNVISIDPNIIEGTEVIMGPGSVIYGSDALGGVMDFHTKSLSYDQLVSGNGLLRYSTANKEYTTHFDVAVGSKRLSSVSSFTYSSFDDLRTGSNRKDDYPDFGKRPFYASQDANGSDFLMNNSNPDRQIRSGFDSWNLVQKIGFKVNQNLLLSYGLYHSNTTDIPRYDRLVEPSEEGLGLANAEWFYGPQKWTMHSLKIELKSTHNFFDRVRMVAAYQDYEENRNDRGFGEDQLRTRTEKVDVYSVNVDFDKGLRGDHSLFYGLELLYNDVDSQGHRQNIFTQEVTSASSRYPDGGSSYYSGSFYASYLHRLPKFVLSGGFRFTTVGLEAKTTDPDAFFTNSDEIDLNNTALNGSLGIVYRGIKNQKLSWLLSTGFRAPNVDDVGKVFELNNNNIVVPNENLKPEFSYNTELSWSGASDHINWRLTGFLTFLNDAILRGDFTVNGQDSILFDGNNRKVFAQVNAGQAYVWGGSLEVNGKISPKFNVKFNITETAGEESTSSEPLRHTTPVFGRLSLIYLQKKTRLELFSDFNGRRLRSDIPTTEIDSKPYLYATHAADRTKDGSPGWITLNLRAKYELTKNIILSAALENILDAHYRPYSSGISAPGRNLIVAVKGRF
ncbi:MAG: TonB-dependent receptor [Bacteroidota bacterium]